MLFFDVHAHHVPACLAELHCIGIKALSALILSTVNLVCLTTETVVANVSYCSLGRPPVHTADSKRLTGLLSQIKKSFGEIPLLYTSFERKHMLRYNTSCVQESTPEIKKKHTTKTAQKRNQRQCSTHQSDL